MPASTSPSSASSQYAGPNWSTSSFHDATASQPMELAALGEHLSQCQGENRRWSTLRHVGNTVHGFAASRFVTTLAVAALLIGATLLAL
ncbi:hypothetical protein [Rhodoferax sp. WC2427]|uniref:hypothetical protein n=1 Tax=Rhodoferax sp. WC2427 TaxID=3234144 RepID=UPI00346621F4